MSLGRAARGARSLMVRRAAPAAIGEEVRLQLLGFGVQGSGPESRA